ncbi:hypothetical protein ACSSWA_13370 [Melioribacter sp. Ez-97]|uniref:hypothetical protein n=1 Tax=Melioribacter sp. Ez-97 TaxID=3423434 RepID=UPI003ED97530
MNYKRLKREYSRNIKLAFALSLIITIIIFISIPSVKRERKFLPGEENAIINLISTPLTAQRNEIVSKRQIKINLNFGLVDDELEMLDDIQMTYSDSSRSKQDDAKNISRARINITPLQIRDVVSAENFNMEGRLLLKLWIDYKGRPVKSEIVSSTLSPSESVKEIIKMAMQSEWLVQNPSPDSLYVVFKEYNFN